FAERPMLMYALYALALNASPLTIGPMHARLHAPAADSIKPRRHTTFGVGISPVPEAIRRLPYLMENEGVLLTDVRADGAAGAASLKKGDIVLAIDGKRVDETTLFTTLRNVPRNQAFRVEYLRDGKWRETMATLDG